MVTVGEIAEIPSITNDTATADINMGQIETLSEGIRPAHDIPQRSNYGTVKQGNSFVYLLE